MSEANSIGEKFAIADIPFYTNLRSTFNNSIYTFSSIESMHLFKKSRNRLNEPYSIQRLDNCQYIGIPLFQCQLKKDSSSWFKWDSSNVIIYKYIVLPSDENYTQRNYLMTEYLVNKEYELVCNNEEHKISIYKLVYSEIKDETSLFSFSTSIKYTINFRDDSVSMTFNNNDGYLEVENSLFHNAKWIHNDKVDDKIGEDFVIDENYKLMLQDESIVSEFDNIERSDDTLDEYMGFLKVANNTKPSSFSSKEKGQYHDNNFLNDFNEKIICMTFALIAHKKYKYNSEITTKRRKQMCLRLLSGDVVTY
ncbi:hypothetical protein HANVADRAFT_51721 [Hanseniaspora valbyensis NRRL Y-1626]|uniref:Uncharacterized protein n=1 Tax=Hanseniaspora valbyensis NRRL Y-1626 TaxID=766949 RepID=A0A1B7TID5_9ASCO|nr:hypothetical protein HANVADRAFT_51721 [Hanseniaspora valbyensis NRRL Y-1626]